MSSVTPRIVCTFAKYIAAALLACLFTWPSAGASEVTYSFTGTAACAPGDEFVCTGATLTVKGTYTLDPSLALTGGPGSVNLVFLFSVSSSNSKFGENLVISSTSPEAFSANIVGGAGQAPNSLIFESNYPAVFDAPYSVTVQLAFGTPTAVDGSIETGTTFSSVQINNFTSEGYIAVFDFTSGTATPQGATSEPPSLLLLGTGLIGIGPFIRARLR